MALTVVLAVMVVAGTALGALRGVRAGLVAVAGTLMAAVLLDLWATPLAGWVRATLRPEQPALPSFAALAAAFLLTAGLLGYGGRSLLPPGRTPARPWLEQLVGGLLGMLNGALAGAYLLRYALAVWTGGEATETVAGSNLAGLLVTWLPLAVLGMAGATGVIIVVRLALALVGRATAAQSSVAGAKSLEQADRRLSKKIDEALGKK